MCHQPVRGAPCRAQGDQERFAAIVLMDELTRAVSFVGGLAEAADVDEILDGIQPNMSFVQPDP